jgi:hypothetical protein
MRGKKVYPDQQGIKKSTPAKAEMDWFILTVLFLCIDFCQGSYLLNNQQLTLNHQPSTINHQPTNCIPYYCHSSGIYSMFRSEQ